MLLVDVVVCLEHDVGRVVKFIGIWIWNPLKTSGGQPMAFGGSVFGLEVIFCLGF